MVRRAALLAFVAASLAACAQLLGIESIHDDAADDAGASLDATTLAETGGGGGEAGPDVAREATGGGDDAPGDDDALDAGPTVNPVFGCTNPDGGTVTFLTNLSAFPLAVAIDRTDLYVADVNGVRRCGIEGCDSGVTLVYPSEPEALAADGLHPIFCANGTVHVTDPSGNDVQSWLANQGCNAIATHGLDVYWGTANALEHGVDGVTSIADIVFADHDGGYVVGLAPTSRYVFFVDVPDIDASAARIARCALPDCDGGDVDFGKATRALGVGLPLVTANDRTVWWTDPTAQQVYSCDVDGCGGIPTIFADASVTALHAENGVLYWGEWSANANGVLHVTPLDGGATVDIATTQRVPASVVLNGACVYWTQDGFFPAHVPGNVTATRLP